MPYNSMTIDLPLEILDAIYEQVGFRDLCHARMASHALCAAATPIAFRSLFVYPNSTRARYSRWLFDQPNIAVHIREIFITAQIPMRVDRCQDMVCFPISSYRGIPSHDLSL